MSNYPPGTGPRDRRAPWNQPEPPTCPECDELIRDREDHTTWCEYQAEPHEMEEDARAAAAEAKWEAREDR